LCLRRHVHEAVAADTGRAVERIDAWTFHAKRMPSSIRRPMYRITGHYPMAMSAGRESLGMEQFRMGHGAASWWTARSGPAAVTTMLR